MNNQILGVSINFRNNCIEIQPKSEAQFVLNWVSTQYQTIERALLAQVVLTNSRLIHTLSLQEESDDNDKSITLNELEKILRPSAYIEFTEKIVELDELYGLLVSLTKKEILGGL